MLELRPCCEHCATSLPPHSEEAMICTFECTFCRSCVEQLENVCPNCGGGFVARPIRPAQNRQKDNYLGRYPATSKITHKPVDLDAHSRLVQAVGHVPPAER